MATTTTRWSADVSNLTVRPAHLEDVRPLLERVVAALGVNGTARILGVNAAQVSRWTKQAAPISSEMSRRILDLHAVLARASRLFSPVDIGRWLVGNEPLLNFARPIDVLTLRGASTVIAALEGIEQGSYA